MFSANYLKAISLSFAQGTHSAKAQSNQIKVVLINAALIPATTLWRTLPVRFISCMLPVIISFCVWPHNQFWINMWSVVLCRMGSWCVSVCCLLANGICRTGSWERSVLCSVDLNIKRSVRDIVFSDWKSMELYCCEMERLSQQIRSFLCAIQLIQYNELYIASEQDVWRGHRAADEIW